MFITHKVHLEGKKHAKENFVVLPSKMSLFHQYVLFIFISVEQKLKLPSLSANARITSEELRDAVVKRQRKVIELLKEN